MADDLQRVDEPPRLAKRATDAHKGNFGRVLIVGGSRGMVGAPALAANAALRGGAGLVTFAAPENVQLAVAVLCPCATSVPLTCDDGGRLALPSVRQLRTALDRCDVAGIGCGLSVGLGQRMLLQAALECKKPLVIDADGLNNLRDIDNWPAIRKAPVVLTPHPGEFSHLTGNAIGEVQSSRLDSAVSAVRRWREQSGHDAPLVCVLKGAATVVTDGARAYVNPTGNPGMASGGSGDVLTGLVAALIGQELAPFEAACLGVWCHGRAGDLAADKLGQVGMIASDLLDFLPGAMREVSE